MKRATIFNAIQHYLTENKSAPYGRFVKQIEVSYYDPKFKHNVVHIFHCERLKKMMSYVGDDIVKDSIQGRVVRYKLTHYEPNEIVMILAMSS